MKKSVLLLLFLARLLSSYSQETVFLETCGNMDVTSSKKVDTYTGWDNSAPVTFTRTTTFDGFADVRITSSTTNHVWFPSGKGSDLIISNINTANYTGLKLSFDIATNKLAGANANKLMLFANDTRLTVPSMTFNDTKFISITDIAIENINVVTLKFQYTPDNNTNGYRLDNFRITGVKVGSDVHSPGDLDFNPYISGKSLVVRNVVQGTIIEIYNLSGTTVQSSIMENSSIQLKSNIKKGLYLIRVGNSFRKIIL